jgi:blue copper oxidase
MKKIKSNHLINIFLPGIFLFCITNAYSQNPLFIPDTISGKVVNLTVQTGTKQFIGTNNTPTLGYNGNFLGPTLLLNKDDSIQFNVKNNLTQATTVHWHGFHVAAKNDGGPDQLISAGGTWNPSFKIRNEAGTFWYHPHGHGKTEIQVTKGLAGMIIVRDTIEKKYILPRKYGVDDFPLIIQSKAFDILHQLASATHEDSVVMVNGTIDPYLNVPHQVVRFRLLNGSADRTYNFGLSDSSNFYLIGSDGGLLAQPYQTNRVRLSPGERAEILINFANYSLATQVYLKSYASELEHGIIGADSVGTSSIVIAEGYYPNHLNGANFNVLRFDVIASTVNPITTIPSTFAPKISYSLSDVDVIRNIHFSPDTVLSGKQGYVDGPFYINNESFDMDSINIVTYLNNTEIWTLTNATMVAHPFHIHDIEFRVLDINGNPPPPQYQGLKDVILVKPTDTVRFITQFTTFSDEMVPYMYHCHLLHHEDEGMMGTFVVLDTNSTGVKELNKYETNVTVYPNPASNTLSMKFSNIIVSSLELYNAVGQNITRRTNTQLQQNQMNLDVSALSNGIYFIHIVDSNRKMYVRKFVVAK